MISSTEINNQIYNHLVHRISVVVLTYNSEKHIKRCVKSIQKQLEQKSELIVIDNNSQDHTVDEVKKIEGVIIVRNKKNYGFAKAINKGIKLSKNDLVLIINPDTWLKPHAIFNLLSCLERSKGDIIGGKAIKVDGTMHGSFVRNPSIATLLFDFSNLRKITPNDQVHRHHYYLDEPSPTTFKYVDVVSGAFMLIKKDVIKKTGYFDENFWMYLEDVDFCVRAKNKKFKVVYCPNSQIVHIGGASSKNKDSVNYDAWYRARSYYAKKHFSIPINLFIQAVFFLDTTITKIWQNLQ